MTRQTLSAIRIGLGVLLLGATAFLVTSRFSSLSRQGTLNTTYYCPMHPGYTSDRPGDCPICNMKLIKKDSQPPAASRQQQKRDAIQSAQDICYMHNCPMMKPGQKCPMMVMAKAGEKVTCPICGTHVAEAAVPPGVRKILYWTDPMIPGYKASGPGTSPMGMDLVPVYEEETGTGMSATAGAPAGYAPVLLTPQKQQFLGVKTAPAQRRTITKTIRTVGRIAYDPALYQTEAEYLQSLKAVAEAQQSARAEGIAEAQRLVDSSRMKLRLLGLSQGLIEEMANWPGPDKSLLLADEAGHVWLYASVYEYELPFVSVGQTISVEIPSVPGAPLEGVIRSIDPVLDPTTRSARVRAILTAPQGTLKPEMYVNASITVTVGDVLAIPEEAIFDTGTKKLVFVDRGQGLFEPRDVSVGLKGDGYYEVKGGIVEGDTVVTSGNFLIDSESRLKAAVEGASSPGHQHGQ